MKPWIKDITRVEVMPRPAGTDLRYSEWTEPLPKKLFKSFINSLSWEDFALYPDTNILKARLAKEHNVQPVNIYLAPGSAEAIRSVFDCMNLGEFALTTDPCFPMYDVYAKQNNIAIDKVLPIQGQYNIIDNNHSGLIIFSRPSNPLGYFFTRNEVIEILENNPMTWVLVDEAYIYYVENRDDITNLISIYDNLIISRSFSKTYGAAGCRIGYLISHSKNIDTISKFRQMYELSGPSLKYAMFLLDNKDAVTSYCKRTITERKGILKLLKKKGMRTIPSEGNWIHIEQNDANLELFSKNKISVKPNIVLPTYNGTWIRFTVGPGILSLVEKLFK